MVYYILFGVALNVCLLFEYRDLLHEKAAIRLEHIQNRYSTAQTKQTRFTANTYRKADHAYNRESFQHWTVSLMH